MLATLKQRGFTSIELLVALAILIALTTLAVPAFTGLLARNQTVATSEALIGLADKARTSAQAQSRPWLLTVKATCAGINPNTACDCAISASCDTASTWNNTQTAPATLTFGARTGAIGSTVSVLVSGTAGTARQVSVAPSGLASSCEGSSPC